MRGLLFVAALCCGLSVENAWAGQPSAEALKRVPERMQRVNIAKGYAEARKRELKPHIDALNSAGKWLAGLNAKKEAESIAERIRAIDPAYLNLKDLDAAITAIAKTAELNEAQQKEWTARQKTLTQSHTQGLIKLANVCYGAGLMGYAYDLVYEILDADPENTIARGALGHIKIKNEWHTKFTATQLQKGQVYLPELGWVQSSIAEKVKGGEWPLGARLVPLKTADEQHAKLATPWEIETDNFILRATVNRKQAMKIAERLEGIRAFVFRQYLDFFQRGSGKRSAQMLFNQASPKKMLVYYFGTKADYDATIDKDLKARDTELLKRSAGFYSPSTSSSYFYHDPDYGQFLYKLMQHEVTHQILGEYAQGGNTPTWLAEGLAEVLEYAVLEEDGQYTLPSGKDHRDVNMTARMLAANQMPSLQTLLGMPNEYFHREPNRSKNYTVSGAFCRFVLEHEKGAFATDFLEFAYDQYRYGRGNLYDYIGGDGNQWEKSFKDYLYGGGKTAKDEDGD